jgi:hypothetical protein
MPNWCNNNVELTHDDNQKLIDAMAAFDEGKFLQTLIPCPQELYDTIAGSYGDPEEQAKLVAQQNANLEKYGYTDWYHWCNRNWGTKWDVGGDDGSSAYNDGTLVLNFDSAWCPPIEAYQKLEEMGFKVLAYYYEPGCHFAGIYQDGNDTCYTEWNDASMELPADLDEMFDISGMESSDEEEFEGDY